MVSFLTPSCSQSDRHVQNTNGYSLRARLLLAAIPRIVYWATRLRRSRLKISRLASRHSKKRHRRTVTNDEDDRKTTLQAGEGRRADWRAVGYHPNSIRIAGWRGAGRAVTHHR